MYDEYEFAIDDISIARGEDMATEFPADLRIIAERDGLIRAVYEDWTILCASERRQYLDLVSQLAHGTYPAPVKEFTKTYRSHVVLIAPKGEKIIFKLSRRERFIFLRHLRTLIKDSEAFETLRSTRRLHKMGLLEIYNPFLAMEKRRWNMIEATILLYDYVEGPDCAEYGEASVPLVVKALKKCHAMGCRHSDATPKNFIIHDGQVKMIDSRFKRNVLGRFGEYCDFMRLEEKLPAVGKYLAFDRGSPPYVAARIYRLVKRDRTVRLIKEMKRNWRSRRFESQQEIHESGSYI